MEQKIITYKTDLHKSALNLRKKGFTLAEILIALVVIGIVAALTIPSLIAKINNKIIGNQSKVFEAKLIKGLNLTKAADDLNNTYKNTYDFLQNGLSKNLKMAKICDADHTRDCVPYDIIKYDRDTDLEESYEIKKMNSSVFLNKKPKDGFKDLASFVMGDGTVVIATYNLGCIQDSGKLDESINKCFAGIYDLNGSRKPNKYGRDVIGFNGASVNVPAVIATINGVKIISALQDAGGITDACDSPYGDGWANESEWKSTAKMKPEYSKFTDKCCRICDQGVCKTCEGRWSDRWLAAAVACDEMGGQLPTTQQLFAIANGLYEGMNMTGGYRNYGYDSNGNKTTLGSGTYSNYMATLNMPTSGFAVWPKDVRDNSPCVHFYNQGDTLANCFWGRAGGNVKTLCVAK